MKINKSIKLQIFKEIIKQSSPFHSSEDESEIMNFLESIWDIRAMPSEENRGDLYNDIYQHIINNYDWAILWKDGNDEKLYFVVESKGTTLFGDLRPKEQGKIDCGKKHFKVLDTEMIVATSMEDVTNQLLMSQQL